MRAIRWPPDFQEVSSKSDSGFDREQADRLVVGLHRPVEGGFACFALLDVNRPFTISGLEAILRKPSETGRQPRNGIAKAPHFFWGRSSDKGPSCRVLSFVASAAGGDDLRRGDGAGCRRVAFGMMALAATTNVCPGGTLPVFNGRGQECGHHRPRGRSCRHVERDLVGLAAVCRRPRPRAHRQQTTRPKSRRHVQRASRRAFVRGGGSHGACGSLVGILRLGPLKSQPEQNAQHHGPRQAACAANALTNQDLRASDDALGQSFDFRLCAHRRFRNAQAGVKQLAPIRRQVAAFLRSNRLFGQFDGRLQGLGQPPACVALRQVALDDLVRRVAAGERPPCEDAKHIVAVHPGSPKRRVSVAPAPSDAAKWFFRFSLNGPHRAEFPYGVRRPMVFLPSALTAIFILISFRASKQAAFASASPPVIARLARACEWRRFEAKKVRLAPRSRYRGSAKQHGDNRARIGQATRKRCQTGRSATFFSRRDVALGKKKKDGLPAPSAAHAVPAHKKAPTPLSAWRAYPVPCGSSARESNGRPDLILNGLTFRPDGNEGSDDLVCQTINGQVVRTNRSFPVTDFGTPSAWQRSPQCRVACGLQQSVVHDRRCCFIIEQRS